MDQVVIIVIIGLISLVNWLMKRSAELREQRKQERQGMGIPEGDPFHPESERAEDAAAPPPPAISPSADMRRLMEALGLPTDDEEPPRPVVREVSTARDEAPQKPVVREAAPVLPPLPAFLPPPPKKRWTTKPPILAPRAPAPANPFSPVLRTRDGIRQAIVLREILGPPKAFTIQDI